MASADVYTSHGGGGVGEAYTCDTPVSTFRDACAVCVWLEQAIHSALCTIYGDTGRYPLFLKRQILASKYCIRLISLLRRCYLRIVYNSLASLDFIGETNWCSHIRSLLFRTNHRDVWENHRVENANRLIKQVKLCLINTYKVDWSIKA